MKKIAIAGAGGFAKEIFLTLIAINKVSPQWDIAGFFDDGKQRGEFFMDTSVLGTVDDLNNAEGITDIVIGVGRSKNVVAIRDKIKNSRFNFPNIIHPTASLHHDSLKIGQGNVMQPGVIFTADDVLGDFNVFNIDVRVGHDTSIGNFNTFGTFTMISGGVIIGNRNDFGINSGILQYKSVGNDNLIAPMSMLYRNIKDNGHYMGSPAIPTGL